MYESGRRSFWKNTPGKSENLRLEIQLTKPSNAFFNEVWYPEFDKDRGDYFGINNSVLENSVSQYDYVEKSFVDNSEAYRDSLPRGFQTEFGGFYINSGKLTLIPISPKKTQKPRSKQNKFPDLKKMIKKPKISSKQRRIIKELKKMKLNIFKQEKFKHDSFPKENIEEKV